MVLVAERTTLGVRCRARHCGKQLRACQRQRLTLGAAPSAAASRRIVNVRRGCGAEHAGKHAAAIETFNAGIVANPACFGCCNNIGYSVYADEGARQGRDRCKKAAELKPDNATAWNGPREHLLTRSGSSTSRPRRARRPPGLVAQRQLAAAAERRRDTRAGRHPRGTGGKAADAKKQFEAAIQANPQPCRWRTISWDGARQRGNLAGAGTEFETYLKLSPRDRNAATQVSVAQLKK